MNQSTLVYRPTLVPDRNPTRRRVAKNKTLILGGCFAGAQVARMLGSGGATIVSPEGSMLYTPLLPEVAAGAIEPRHVYVPLRRMCPDAELIRGHAVGLDEDARTVSVETDIGVLEVEYERLVIALGSTARMLPIPGLAEHAIAFKNLADAIRLRNHVLRRLDIADADLTGAARALTFVFVGAGYAGVEALAETMQLVRDVLRHYPRLHGIAPRWVLVNAGPRVLAEVPDKLGDYAVRLLLRRRVEVLNSTTLSRVEEHAVTLSDGTRIEADTLVWTAGVVPNPVVQQLGLPLDEGGRLTVGSSLRVEGRDNIWALGDCARVPNKATPERPDPPTCQHALRQARALARSLHGRSRPYRYKSIGEGVTLGRDKGIARLFGIRIRGRCAALVTRFYHLRQVPLFSRRLRILADGLLSTVLRRDMVELGSIEAPRRRP